MCDPQTFDSRDSRYKRPYGAVPSGTRVELALRPPRAGGFSAATLIAYFEHRDEERRELPMPWRGLEGDRDVFAVTLETGDYVGLVWYSFRLEGLDGRREELGPFQLTVYDGAEEVPAWFGEGVTYQIFPDRFRRTRVPDPTGTVGGRSVHTGWEEEPVYRPDSNGEVRNRDFFGGDLAGVREKLGYLRGLGVDTLYFCPIFEAPENHRYGTGDYEKIDPMLGTEADFRALCTDAHALGMRVVLDGVFNHQGFVSRYFNGDGSYESVGAVQSQDSPYYPWYHFSHWPDKYDSWWGIYSLPAVNEADSSYRRYIFGGADSIIRRWLAAGADGWRLDVADELPDEFIAFLRRELKARAKDGILIGEVWEDASTKQGGCGRRRYTDGRELDGVMNYVFADAVISFLTGKQDAEALCLALTALRQNYPKPFYDSCLTMLSSHDTVRLLTVLAGAPDRRSVSREVQAHFVPEESRLNTAKKLMTLAQLIQLTHPGIPCIYYGDEAGMQGMADPFSRRTYPWGSEDAEIQGRFTAIASARKDSRAIRYGKCVFAAKDKDVFITARYDGNETALSIVNRSGEVKRVAVSAADFTQGPDADGLKMPNSMTDALTDRRYESENGTINIELGPYCGALLK